MNYPSRASHGTTACWWLLLCSLVAVLSSLRPAPLAAQAVPDGYDQGIFEVRIPRLTAATLPVLLNPKGQILLPFDRVLGMTGLPVQRSPYGMVRSVPEIGGGNAELDMGTRQIRRRGMTIPLAPDDAILLGAELYLQTDRLAEFLAAEVTVDFGTLTATISRRPPFPAERDRALQARRSNSARRLERDSTHRLVPYRGETGGFVVDWGLSSGGAGLRRTNSFQARLGLALAGGDLTLGGNVAEGYGMDGAAWMGHWSYRRAFPAARWVRQLQMGDLIGGGAVLRSLQGVSITNRDLTREQFFTQVPVLPSVPQGWQYEVYQDGQLLGFSEGTSADPIFVSTRYGSTPLQVRMYGPAGEQVVSEFLYQVPSTQLQPGRLEYAAGAGRCPTAECTVGGFVDVAYGVSRWLTLQGGAEHHQDTSGAPRLTPHGAMSLASLSGWSAQLQAMRASFVRGSVTYFGARPLYGTFMAGQNWPGFGQPSYLAPAPSRWYTDMHLGVRRGGEGRTFHSLQLRARAEGTAGNGLQHWVTALEADHRRGSVAVQYEQDRQAQSGVTGLSVLALTPQRGPGWLQNSAIRGFVGTDGSGLHSTELAASVRVGRFGAFSVGGQWLRVRRSSQLTLSYSTVLPFARSTARVIGTSAGGHYESAVLNGSLSFDQRLGLVVDELSGVGAAGIQGTVFYDEDGDGVFGPGDTPAAKVPVLAGGNRLHTDSLGRFHSWNLVPYEVTEVAIDTVRGLDPSWIPLRAQTLMRATPHRYTEASFPLVRTRELAGTLVANDGVFTAGGVTLKILDAASQKELTTVSFSDGVFYLSRMRPGDYVLTVSPTALEALEAVAEPDTVRFTVPALGADPIVELAPIQLRPRRLENVETVVIAADADLDGVPDLNDKCPQTPFGTKVDAVGCTVVELFATSRVITLKGVNFAVGTARLTPSSRATLNATADALLAQPEVRVEVAGHTDATGSRATNTRLSRARAETVMRYLHARGVPLERMTARGYGPDEPVASNATAQGRAQNRRTELRRLDIGGQ